MSHQKKSSFPARKSSQVQDTPLDQHAFLLEDAAHARLVALLDAPPNIPRTARTRLRRKAPWRTVFARERSS